MSAANAVAVLALLAWAPAAVAAAAALVLMSMGYIVFRACQAPTLGWARMFTPAIPVVYIGAVYFVFILAQR